MGALSQVGRANPSIPANKSLNVSSSGYRSARGPGPIEGAHIVIGPKNWPPPVPTDGSGVRCFQDLR